MYRETRSCFHIWTAVPCKDCGALCSATYLMLNFCPNNFKTKKTPFGVVAVAVGYHGKNMKWLISTKPMLFEYVERWDTYLKKRHCTV